VYKVGLPLFYDKQGLQTYGEVGSTSLYLITVDTSRLERLGMMSAAVDVRVFIEVNEIDQQLDADHTDEARRVPDDVTSGPTGEHRQLALLHSFTTLSIRHNHHYHHHQQQQQQQQL